MLTHGEPERIFDLNPIPAAPFDSAPFRLFGADHLFAFVDAVGASLTSLKVQVFLYNGGDADDASNYYEQTSNTEDPIGFELTGPAKVGVYIGAAFSQVRMTPALLPSEFAFLRIYDAVGLTGSTLTVDIQRFSGGPGNF